MPDADTATAPPADARLDPTAVAALLERARLEVEEGRTPACQVALGLHGEVVLSESFGAAKPGTRFNVFSCTKAAIAAVVWQLIGEGRLSESTTTGELVPDLGADGPDAERMSRITLGELLTHTAGFPFAPLGPPRWATQEGRREQFRRWRLTWEPGSRFTYHPTAAHWVVAEMVEVVDGRPLHDVVRERVVRPMGLPTFGLGDPPGDQGEVAELVMSGEPPSPEELAAMFGTDEVPAPPLTPEMLMAFNHPEVRAVGVPGGGAQATAADLALLHQELLFDRAGLFDPDVLVDARSRIRCTLPDPMTGIAANRTLGLVRAGDDGNAVLRGFGHTVSGATTGHNGAGGQLSWCDPESGLSLGFVTAGLDRNPLREGRRSASIASRAGLCVAR